MSKGFNPNYIIYTDGGCAINPSGPGAYGAVIISTDTGEITELSQGYSSTTNNRMEIMAVIAALKFVKEGAVSLYSDSQYVLRTIDGSYQKKKNKDLWEELDQLLKNFKMDLHWVRGHNGNKYNERCDEMCSKAMYDLEHLIKDTGYLEIQTKKREFMDNTKNMKAGSMGVEIALPENYELEMIHIFNIDEYAKTYQVNISCAEKIIAFQINRARNFKAYMKIKTGRQDYWSRKKMDELLEGLERPDEVLELVKRYLPENADQVSCLRWYRRGLPLNDSIRKVLVDNEVKENCYKK